MSPADGRDPSHLAERYRTTRDMTERLCAPLSAEDCAGQSMRDASPAKWHLAHTSWFFETLVLETAVPGYAHFEESFRVLFNSYYNTVGKFHPRPERGLLTRPPLSEVLRYRGHVDQAVLSLLRSDRADEAVRDVIRVGIEHEQQHQELILTDVLHLLSFNPLHPAYADLPAPPPGEFKPLSWHHFAGGICEIGYGGEDFCFDNERPRHRVILAPFEIASRPVTNGEFLAFMGDTGYERPELWLSDGWIDVNQRGWRAPLYWEKRGDRWCVHTLGGLRELSLNEPVCHVSYYEADAYARWAAARLPTEAEWESAAAAEPVSGNLLERGLLHPAPIEPEAVAEQPAQLYGDVWEWTQSPYAAYPGYRPPDGALGEYNGKFMCNQLVLRGGSCATPASHIRASYRNFWYPNDRWQFSGFRLARDSS